jgi:hypothetical protein
MTTIIYIDDTSNLTPKDEITHGDSDCTTLYDPKTDTVYIPVEKPVEKPEDKK